MGWRVGEATRRSLGVWTSKWTVLAVLYLLSPSIRLGPSSTRAPSTSSTTTAGEVAHQNVPRAIPLRIIPGDQERNDDRDRFKAIDQLAKYLDERRTARPVVTSTEHGREVTTSRDVERCEASRDDRRRSGRTASTESTSPGQDEIHLHSSSSSPSSAWWSFTPLGFTFVVLHLLYLVQMTALHLEPKISQILLSNPIPPPFHTPLSKDKAHRPSISKLVTHARWRSKVVYDRLGGSLCQLAFLTLVIGVVAKASLVGDSSERHGWNQVVAWDAAARLSGGRIDLQLYHGQSPVGGLKPLRSVVFLESMATLLIMLASFSPVLVSLGHLPSSLPMPTAFVPRRPQKVPPNLANWHPSIDSKTVFLVPTSHLVPRYLSLSLASLRLLQTLALCLSRPRSAQFRFLSFATLSAFFSTIACLGDLGDGRDEIEREVTRVLQLLDRFPVSLNRTPGDLKNVWRLDGWYMNRMRLEEIAFRKEKRNLAMEREQCARGEAPDEWICTICYEGDYLSDDEDGRDDNSARQDGRVLRKGFRSRVRLPVCAHRLHAHCLATWFARQNFCPTCHEAVPEPNPEPDPIVSPGFELRTR
ncbi:hypothetical protein JCM10212_001239 [Sporobolomyces blumeae]